MQVYRIVHADSQFVDQSSNLCRVIPFFEVIMSLFFNFDSFLPSPPQGTFDERVAGSNAPRYPVVRRTLRAAYNIAFASLAAFAIVGSAACAFHVVFSR